VEYITMAFIIILLIYPLSYSKHNWNKNNKIAAIGTILVTLFSLFLPFYILFLR